MGPDDLTTLSINELWDLAHKLHSKYMLLLEKGRKISFNPQVQREYQQAVSKVLTKYNAIHEILLKKRLELGLSPEVAE